MIDLYVQTDFYMVPEMKIVKENYRPLRFKLTGKKINEKYEPISTEQFEYAAAVHEAGHILIGELLQPQSVEYAYVDGSELSDCVGFTKTDVDEKVLTNIDEIDKAMICELAGKAASELVLTEKDLGTAGDLPYVVANIERAMQTGVYGFEYLEYNDSSEESKARREQFVTDKIQEYLDKATAILKNHKDALLAIADYLYLNKTIDGDTARGIIDLTDGGIW